MRKDLSTENVRHQWYKSSQEFLAHQKELEKSAKNKTNQWTFTDEIIFAKFSEQVKELVDAAKFTRKPSSSPALKKIYRHQLTGDYWHMNIYFWPDGSVQFAHNRIAETRRV